MSCTHRHKVEVSRTTITDTEQGVPIAKTRQVLRCTDCDLVTTWTSSTPWQPPRSAA